MDLRNKTREELVEIAQKLNIKVHHKAKPETIMHQINQQPQAYKSQAMIHKAEEPMAPIYSNTEEDVNQAIAAYLKKDGFKAEYPGDNTVIFSYKGAEESCNLSIPLRLIRSKAEIVSVGKRVPRRLAVDGNHYTDQTLM